MEGFLNDQTIGYNAHAGIYLMLKSNLDSDTSGFVDLARGFSGTGTPWSVT